MQASPAISAKDRAILRKLGIKVPKKPKPKSSTARFSAFTSTPKSRAKTVEDYKAENEISEAIKTMAPDVLAPKPYTLGTTHHCRLCKATWQDAIRFELFIRPYKKPALQADPFATPLYQDADKFNVAYPNTCPFCARRLAKLPKPVIIQLLTKLAIFAESSQVQLFSNFAHLTCNTEV